MKITRTPLLALTVLISSVLLSACIPGLNRNQQTPADQSARQQESEAKQMMAAIESGQSLKCVMTSTKDGQTVEYFLKGKKMNVNSSALVEGKTQVSHMINDGEYFYTWTDEPAQGMKIKMPSEEEMKAQEEKYEEYLGDTPDFTDEEEIKEYEESGYTIDCDPISVPDSQFIPPTNIQFQDTSAMMEAATKIAPQDGAEGMTPEQKAAYEQMMKQYGE